MFHVLVSTPAPRHWDSLRFRPAAGRRDQQPLAGVSGKVDPDRLAVFAHLEGHRIRCTAGYLWVTVEDDPEDHVLAPGQWLRIAAPGKVIVGGRGGYVV